MTSYAIAMTAVLTAFQSPEAKEITDEYRKILNQFQTDVVNTVRDFEFLYVKQIATVFGKPAADEAVRTLREARDRVTGALLDFGKSAKDHSEGTLDLGGFRTAALESLETAARGTHSVNWSAVYWRNDLLNAGYNRAEEALHVRYAESRSLLERLHGYGTPDYKRAMLLTRSNYEDLDGRERAKTILEWSKVGYWVAERHYAGARRLWTLYFMHEARAERIAADRILDLLRDLHELDDASELHRAVSLDPRQPVLSMTSRFLDRETRTMWCLFLGPTAQLGRVTYTYGKGPDIAAIGKVAKPYLRIMAARRAALERHERCVRELGAAREELASAFTPEAKQRAAARIAQAERERDSIVVPIPYFAWLAVQAEVRYQALGERAGNLLIAPAEAGELMLERLLKELSQ